jgi:hypothetical protein
MHARECLCGRAQLNFVYSTCHGDQALVGNSAVCDGARDGERERPIVFGAQVTLGACLREFAAESDCLFHWIR